MDHLYTVSTTQSYYSFAFLKSICKIISFYSKFRPSFLEDNLKYRQLGMTDITVSEVGFGTGGISKLMVEEDWDEQNSAITKAIKNGITYFDTAAAYGKGKSEKNLGRILKKNSSV